MGWWKSNSQLTQTRHTNTDAASSFSIASPVRAGDPLIGGEPVLPRRLDGNWRGDQIDSLVWYRSFRFAFLFVSSVRLTGGQLYRLFSSRQGQLLKIFRVSIFRAVSFDFFVHLSRRCCSGNNFPGVFYRAAVATRMSIRRD